MKRALAAALLIAVAACSSGREDGAVAVVATTSPTSGFQVDPEEGFLRAMESRFDQTGATADAAVVMVKATCDMLDTTDSVSAGLGDTGLGLMFNEFDGPEEQLGEVLVIGSEYFCPEHRTAVVGYISSHNLGA